MSWKNHFSVDKNIFFQAFLCKLLCSWVGWAKPWPYGCAAERRMSDFPYWFFYSWARNDFGSAFWLFFTPGQTPGFEPGSFERSSPVLSHHTDAAVAVSPSGSGFKLSLHFWGTSLLSWFYWGKIPPLITPHWHTLRYCWLGFVLQTTCKCYVWRYKMQNGQVRWPGCGKSVTRTAKLSWALCGQVTKSSNNARLLIFLQDPCLHL